MAGRQLEHKKEVFLASHLEEEQKKNQGHKSKKTN
jgi:hypothetical protein